MHARARADVEEWSRPAAVLALSLALHAALWFFGTRPAALPSVPPHEVVRVTLLEPAPPREVAPAPPAPAPTRAEKKPRAPRVTKAPEPPKPKPAAPPQPELAEAPREPPRAPESAAPPAPAPAAETAPGNVNLFAPGALDAGLSNWRQARAEADQQRDAERAVNPASAQAEAKRVGKRIAAVAGYAQAKAFQGAGFYDLCDNGIDDELDGYLDCASPGCIDAPVCRGTHAYADEAVDAIPDTGQLERSINVQKIGSVRKLTVRVSLVHDDPQEVSLVLIAPDGRRSVLSRGPGGHGLVNAAFYARDMIGTPSGGRWRLQVSDRVQGHEGRLLAWELVVTTAN